MDTREAGWRGGKAGTGKAKVRGDSAYYSKLRMKALREARDQITALCSRDDVPDSVLKALREKR